MFSILPVFEKCFVTHSEMFSITWIYLFLTDETFLMVFCKLIVWSICYSTRIANLGNWWCTNPMWIYMPKSPGSLSQQKGCDTKQNTTHKYTSKYSGHFIKYPLILCFPVSWPIMMLKNASIIIGKTSQIFVVFSEAMGTNWVVIDWVVIHHKLRSKSDVPSYCWKYKLWNKVG